MARFGVLLGVLALSLSAQSSRIVRFTVEEIVDDSNDVDQPSSALSSFLSLLRTSERASRREPAGKVSSPELLPPGESPQAVDAALPLLDLLPAAVDGQQYPRDEVVMGPVKGFSWDNCGKPSSVLTISQFSMTPDPIPNPGTVTLVLKGSLSQQVNSPIEADVVLEKKVAFVWVRVPCEGGKGSCSYADVCSMVPPGTCPIQAGPQSLTKSFKVPSVPSGDYQVTVDMKYKGTWLACVHATLTLA